MTAATLDLYDLAFLAGGPDRVVDTAVVLLVESGRVRVHGQGELAAADPARGHPVEAAVLDAIGTRGHRSVDTVRWRLAGDERVTAPGRSLAAAGLVRAAGAVRRRTWRTTRTGRRVLAEALARPPADRALDGGSAVAVALHGPVGMADPALRAAIFDRPPLPAVPSKETGRRLRELRRQRELDDPTLSARHTGTTAVGGGIAFGGFEGGAGDGGGF